ncbi:MAG: S-adenosylmethionine:tRNA ribosyltransferase-isomerase [Candidatus Magasanikbacteria bacterium]|nr:S-adenosylmethionine:tRNA ribosyltransferase-isomerase [Candidatus Magasanikbacteria bacterium]
MKTAELDYFLPPEQIAQRSVEPRDHSKLLVADRVSGEMEHLQFYDIVKFLRPDDILVFNNTKVFRARLRVGAIEILLLRPANDAWLAEYQTVYARHTGSVAAPTAGFHFTKELREKIQSLGVTFLEVTLHVGIGTFQPVKTELVEAHPMHSEWVNVDAETAGAIAAAKKAGRRVIAVGTTTTRALEGAAAEILAGKSFEGDVNIFINPGYKFKIIDGLVTNFHLPKSTLLLLVSAFLGDDGLDRLKKIYADAITRKYRFFSFGDGMFIN